MPGPGQYDAKPIIGNEGIKSIIHPRLKESQSAASLKTPGPGTYDPELIKKAPSYAIGKSQRTKEKTTTGPGPGVYDPQYGKKMHTITILK